MAKDDPHRNSDFLKDAERLVRLDHVPTGSNHSEHPIAVSLAVDQGLLPIEDVPEDQLKQIVAFAAAAGVNGVSATYYRDIIERRRNEAIGDVGRIKLPEEKSRRTDKARYSAIGVFLDAAIRAEARARERGRPSPPYPNQEITRLVGIIVDCELKLIDMGTRTRDPEDKDQSLFRRAPRLAQIIEEMLNKSKA